MSDPRVKQPTKASPPTPAMKQELEPRALRPIDQFRQELVLRRNAFRPMLPRHIPVEKFEAAVIAAVSSSAKLLECTKASLFKSCAEAAELGLSMNPSLRECDILPVWNSRLNQNEAQLRPRFIGLMKLARQSGEIKKIYAHVVREGDAFEYELGLDKRLNHKVGKGGEVTHAYCVWETQDGTKDFEVMDVGQIRRIMSRAGAKNRSGEVIGPWVTDFEEMCRKTVVRRSSKYMPMSPENLAFVNAVRVDDLREGGRDVRIEGGAVFDMTEGPDDTAEETVQEPAEKKQSRQISDLEKKITVKQEPAPAPEPEAEPAPEFEVIYPARTKSGGTDWHTWVAQVEKTLAPLDAKSRRAWVAANSAQLDGCEMNAPDIMDGILQLIQS